MKTPTLTKALALLFVCLSYAQLATGQTDPLIFNNGAMFYINGGVNDSAVVWVDGGVTNNDSTMVNLGKFIIHGDFVNNGESGGDGIFPLQIPPNNGLFEVYGNWENNGIFRAGQGKVKFLATDTVKGSEVTRFHDVDLIGDIRRIQESVNVEVGENGTLRLNQGEWATDFDTLWIHNTATGAIQRDVSCDTCGYVSSLDNGNLARAVEQNATYNFPTGSGLNISPNQFERYRPVEITPSSNDADWFHVRFVNREATINGLPILNIDTTICYVNPWWYHRINKTGNGVNEADLTFYANLWEGDERYDGVANWNELNNQWENMGNTSSGVLNGVNQVIRNAWDDYQVYEDDAYILAFQVPQEPVVSGDTALCADIATTYNVPANGSDYDFAVTGGTIINETDYSITVIWDNDILDPVIGTIEVVETIPNGINGGCASLTRVFNVEVWPLPIANFSVVTDSTLPGGIFIHDILEMADSSINTVDWYWDFDDGITSTDSLPFHAYYQTGTYNIRLVTTSDLGCLDTLIIPVDVVEGLIVPNVFTPNNDGWNDVFDVRTSDVGPFKLEIYNRWGNVVFENASPLISWDGTTSTGLAAPAGTYFYVISRAEMNSGNAIDNELENFSFKETGWLQLLR